MNQRYIYECFHKDRGCNYVSNSTSNRNKHSLNSCAFRTIAERQLGENVCGECGFTSQNPESFNRHVELCRGIIQPKFACDPCNQLFTTQAKLNNHKRSKHFWDCKMCPRKFQDIIVSIFLFRNIRKFTLNMILAIP